MRIAAPLSLTPVLQVPATMIAALDAAVAAGREEAAGWARVHPTGSTKRFHRDALERLQAPPAGDAAAADLEAVRDATTTRTQDGDERALHLSRRAGWDEWEQVIREIGEAQGPAQARRAARLVQVAAARTDEVTGDAKRAWGRLRPYEVDASIPTIVPQPHGNAGYPSGHTSGAYAAALALAAVAPERRDELLALAAEAGWARIYGGVHFPSDVLAGARLASAVVADVLRREAAGLPDR